MARNKYRKYKYTIEYACGHTDIAYFGGYTEEYADDRAKDEESYNCPACRKEKLAKKRAEESARIAKEAKEQGLPDLTGTEKQVQWAVKLRDDFFELEGQIKPLNEEEINAILEDPDLGEKDKIRINKFVENYKDMRAAIDNFTEQTEAKVFIDNKRILGIDFMSDKFHGFDGFFLEHMERIIDNLESFIEKYKPLTVEEKIIEEQQEEISKELTVFPENYNHEPTVNVFFNEKDNTVDIKSPKNEEIIELCRSYDYKWSNPVWYKKITNFTGDKIHRMAEIGNKILALGFAVEFDNPESQQLAISGDYEPETLNWVSFLIEEEQPVISWVGLNHEFFEASHKIKGAKWKHGKMHVPITSYLEILDFADVYDFGVSPGFKEEVEKFKNKIAANTAEVKEKERVVKENELDKILNSSTEVIDDLKDDE